MILLPVTVEAQTASDFENRMKVYTDSYIENNMNRYDTEKTTMTENNETISLDDFRAYLNEEAKSKFIKENIKEYMNVYFPPSAMIAGDTFVCDNGGFEEGFKYYNGFTSSFGYGSSNCIPGYYNIGPPITFVPSDFTQVPMPVPYRFEIVTSGRDPLTGLQQTKFGNNALKINNQYGHSVACTPGGWVDRVVKQFKVTHETKDFTIWYAVVLENPTGHDNQQPFLSIKCDKAPEDNLCFDASNIMCANQYNDNICYRYSNVKVQDWTCHTFTIPEEFVGSIATLEITVADCGQEAHMGYAFIDGICEPCDSAISLVNLKTINYSSCYGPDITPFATVCGEYRTIPPNAICKDKTYKQYKLIDVNVPGYEIENIRIHGNNTFCFDFPITYFTTEECVDLYVEAYLLNGYDTLPVQISNSLEICKDLYEIVECSGGEVVSIDTCGVVKVGGCNNNSTTPNISDDYYYVYVSLLDPDTIGWRLDRGLVDPYPNENSIHTLAAGEGDTINLILGPFLIQEGDWGLKAYMAGCNATAYIDAPDYCSGCEEFQDIEISNVACDPNNPNKWNFTIKVFNENAPNPPLNYKLSLVNPPSTLSWTFAYNTINPVNHKHLISHGCLVFRLQDGSNPQCESYFTICPPKPCNDNCRLEVYVQDVECLSNERSQSYSGHAVHLEISGMDPNTQQLCISYKTPGNTIPVQLGSYNDNGIYVLGPFNEDIYLEVKICNKGADCRTCTSACYKFIYIPKPDCEKQKEIEDGIELREMEKKGIVEKPLSSGELLVIPNPFSADEFILRSTLEHTVYEIYDFSGKFIQKGKFDGAEQRVKLIMSKGSYFIRYTNRLGEPAIVKMIKL